MINVVLFIFAQTTKIYLTVPWMSLVRVIKFISTSLKSLQSGLPEVILDLYSTIKTLLVMMSYW